MTYSHPSGVPLAWQASTHELRPAETLVGDHVQITFDRACPVRGEVVEVLDGYRIRVVTSAAQPVGEVFDYRECSIRLIRNTGRK